MKHSRLNNIIALLSFSFYLFLMKRHLGKRNYMNHWTSRPLMLFVKLVHIFLCQLHWRNAFKDVRLLKFLKKLLNSWLLHFGKKEAKTFQTMNTTTTLVIWDMACNTAEQWRFWGSFPFFWSHCPLGSILKKTFLCETHNSSIYLPREVSLHNFCCVNVRSDKMSLSFRSFYEKWNRGDGVFFRTLSQTHSPDDQGPWNVY